MRNFNRKKVIGWFIAALVLIGIIATNVYQQQRIEKTEKPVVKIGVTLPLTGSMARLGQQAKKAVDLRISEVPSDSRFEYKVLFEDDQLQSSKEFTNAQKLINFNNVDVMISGFSGGASAIAGLADKAKVVYWNFQWTDEIVKTSPYAFTYNQMPKDVVKLWLDTAYQKGLRKIAIVNNETHAGGEYVISAAEELLPNYPEMEIVSIERVPLFGSDLRTTLLKMNAQKPDIYLSVLLAPTFDEFAQKMKEQNITTPISSINRFEHAKNKELFEGNWGVGANDYHSDFFAKYQKKYMEEISSEMAPYIYDVVDVIIKAYEINEHKANGKELSQELLKMKNYQGGFGTIISDENGIFHIPVVVGTMKNGQFVANEE
ncbi:MAG: ABC transporter substrate-binding protein [Alphaproteobacteria bacterium]|nr:ABC transporter substrate-binding protein [Alphaproteobacteria bacterium]